jgi:putative glutamine amidotransferase
MRDLGADALVLTGGNATSLRDETERKLVDAARAHALPILGVCHGLQFLNAYFGGTVNDNIAAFEKGHVNKNHGITLSGFLQKSIDRRTIEVNSFHNLGVTSDTIAQGLVPLAQTDAGVIEAFAHESLPLLAIQWHPERKPMGSAINDYIFNRWLKTGGGKTDD